MPLRQLPVILGTKIKGIMNPYLNMKTLDIDKVAAAIEADAGQSLPGLRESLSEAKDGSAHSPASSVAFPPAAAVLTVTVCSPQNR